MFITGATGFLGKIVLEKILWDLDSIHRIYLLIR
jgi:thioester reductase-like protein